MNIQEDTIKVGRYILFQMKCTSKMSIQRRLKYNFFEIDNILPHINEIECVIVTEEDFSQMDLIVKFCQVTFIPIHIYYPKKVPLNITTILKKNNIIYEIKQNEGLYKCI